MRSLFHFPLPCTTTLAVTVSYSNRPTAPEMSRRPHPAPMRRQRRSPVLLSAARPLPGPALTGPWPTVTRSQGARHAAPPSLPRAAAVLHVLRFAVRIAPTVRRHPRHPPISLLALRRPQGPGWQESHRMHPLLAECAKKAPFLAASARNACFSRSRWQHPRPMHPFPGAIGRFGMHGARILPPRALFRVEEPEITHGAKMLPAPPGLSPAAACGPAERALRPAARAWPACRMRPSLSSRLCPPRPAPPRHLARVHRRRLTRAALRRPRPATRSPYRCISPPARRTHPASRAHPPRPGNKRNSTNNSMRA